MTYPGGRAQTTKSSFNRGLLSGSKQLSFYCWHLRGSILGHEPPMSRYRTCDIPKTKSMLESYSIPQKLRSQFPVGELFFPFKPLLVLTLLSFVAMSEVNDSSSLNPSISINDLSPAISAESLSPSVAVEQLSPNISLYQPKVSTVENGSAPTPSLKHPNLILPFSWTGAQQKHITKYTLGYFARFPSTPIMVITTSIKDLTY